MVTSTREERDFIMAYVSKEKKADLAPAMKAVAKKYGFKLSVSVKHHSTIVAKIKDADLIIEDYALDDPWIGSYGLDVNQYHIDSQFNKYAKFLNELHDAMLGKDYFDHSDAMTDYFHRSHYTAITLFPSK